MAGLTYPFGLRTKRLDNPVLKRNDKDSLEEKFQDV